MFDWEQDDEHTGIDFVEIYKLFASLDSIFFETESIDRVEQTVRILVRRWKTSDIPALFREWWKLPFDQRFMSTQVHGREAPGAQIHRWSVCKAEINVKYIHH